MTDYANTEERDAAIEKIKQQCRDIVTQLNAYRPGRVTAMPMWVDGVWGDTWYVELDGQDIGEIQYDGYGPVVKGDTLSTLTYEAADFAESRAVAAGGRLLSQADLHDELGSRYTRAALDRMRDKTAAKPR